MASLQGPTASVRVVGGSEVLHFARQAFFRRNRS
jgi:hypothetical protein